MIELLVTLAVLSIILSVATLAMRRIDEHAPTDLGWLVADSLNGVVDRARAVRIDARASGADVSAALFVDGSVVADSAFAIDRLTGTRTNAR